VRVSRALEIHELTGQPISHLWEVAASRSRIRAFTVLLAPPLPALRALIEARVDAMMASGFLEEVRALRNVHGRAAPALGALGYKQLGAHLDGAVSEAAAVGEIKAATVAYARRQRTWFREGKEEISQVLGPVGAHEAAASVPAVLDAFRRAREGAGRVTKSAPFRAE